MIISHEYSYIFLKTRKTAGTSLDVALSRFCGPMDVITPLNSDGAEMRGNLGYLGPQNYQVPLSQWRPKDVGKVLIKKKRTIYTQHMPAKDLKKRLSSRTWSTYFKFCVERNPFDKAISLYYWRTREMVNKPTLLEFLRSVELHHLSNFEIYTINGRPAIDHIVRYENLRAEMKEIAARLGLASFTLPETLRQYREDRRHYRDVMGKHEKELVEKVCSRELKLLEYEF